MVFAVRRFESKSVWWERELMARVMERVIVGRALIGTIDLNAAICFVSDVLKLGEFG
jgi:hypothetical protein